MSDQAKRRPRIDTILNAIKEGTYDDKLNDLQEALAARRKIKQEELLSLVQEVYGPNATIVQQKQQLGAATIQSAGSRSFEAAGEGEPGKLQEDLSEEAEIPDIESRSPVIGPFNPS